MMETLYLDVWNVMVFISCCTEGNVVLGCLEPHGFWFGPCFNGRAAVYAGLKCNAVCALFWDSVLC